MKELPLLIEFGVIDGAILAVAALGFTLQFGITNMVNFAYGEFITFGAYGVVITNSLGLRSNFWEALLVGGASVALLSFCVGQFVYGPFFRRRREILYTVALTFGMSLILVNTYIAIWGYDPRQLLDSYPSGANDVHSIGPFLVTTLQILFVLFAAVCLVVVHGLLKYTRLGKSMRAISDNRDLAAACGLNIGRITGVTWLVTGFLAGVAGVIQALQSHNFDPTLGDTFVYLVFAAVILGGIGRPWGAVIGAVILGLVTQLAVPIVGAAVSPVAVFVVLIGLMLFRPNGLFGTTGRTSFA